MAELLGNGNGSIDIADIKRLEGSFLNLEKAYAITREDTTALKFASQAMQGEISKLATAISTLSEKLESRSKPNLPFLGMLLTLMLAFPGGALYIVRGDIEHSISPLNAEIKALTVVVTGQRNEVSRLDQLVTASTASDAQSRTDREQLNHKVAANDTKIADMAVTVQEMDARFSAALAEIESQFHSVSDVGNIHLAQQNRMNALLWEKVNPGQRYPSDIFFPSSIFNQTPLAGTKTNGHSK